MRYETQCFTDFGLSCADLIKKEQVILMSFARIGSYHQSGGGIGSIILSAFFFIHFFFPLLNI